MGQGNTAKGNAVVGFAADEVAQAEGAADDEGDFTAAVQGQFGKGRCIFSPSLSRTWAFWAGDGFSGIFSSGRTVTSTWPYGRRRFKNSSMPAVRYFSLILPMVMT